MIGPSATHVHAAPTPVRAAPTPVRPVSTPVRAAAPLSTGQRRVLQIVRQLVQSGDLQPVRGPTVYALSVAGSQRALSAPVTIAQPGDLAKWPDAMQQLARDELAHRAAAGEAKQQLASVVVQHRMRGRPTEYMTVAL